MTAKQWTMKAVYPCDCYGPNAPFCTIERPMPNCNRKQRREATVFIMDAPDTPVAKVATPEAAQRIVRAVNAQDALMEALAGLCDIADELKAGERDHDPQCALCAAVRKARAAIALATGTSDEGERIDWTARGDDHEPDIEGVGS